MSDPIPVLPLAGENCSHDATHAHAPGQTCDSHKTLPGAEGQRSLDGGQQSLDGSQTMAGAVCGAAPVDESSLPEPPKESEMLDALKQVVDPELFVNIVDLGLIYSIERVERKVGIEMTLTSPACPAGPQLIQQTRMVLEKFPGVTSVEVKLVMSPPWTPDRMTDEARDQLGIF